MAQGGLSFIDWDVTPRCNLNCRHCYAASLYRETHYELSLEEMECITENLCILPINNIGLFGGEPLLRKDLPQIVELCVKKNSNPYVITNGILLSESQLESLLEAGLKGIGVSIDGATKETYMRIRHKSDFDKLMRNMSLLNESPLESITVNVVVSRINFHEVGMIIEMAQSFGATRICLEMLAYQGNAISLGRNVILSPREFIDLAESVVETLLRLDTDCDFASMVFATPPLIHYLNEKYGINLPVEPRKCKATTSTLFIKADGIAYPCKGAVPELSLKNHDIYVSHGHSLLENTIIDILSSEDFERLFYMYSPSTIAENLPKCADCDFFPDMCMPCPISAMDPEKEYGEICEDYPLGRICEEVMRVWR